MSPQDRLAQDEYRSSVAKQLLDNPVFKSAINSLIDEYTSVWRDSAPSQTAEREDAYQALRAINRVQRDLEAVLSGAAITAHNLRKTLAGMSRAG